MYILYFLIVFAKRVSKFLGYCANFGSILAREVRGRI